MMSVGIGRWRSPETTPVGRLLRPIGARSVRSAGSEKRNHLFVFGTGFVGRHVSKSLLADGWQVSGTCTDAVKKRTLEEMGIDAFVFDATKSKLIDLHTLQNATHVLVSIPPVGSIGDPLVFMYDDLKSILSQGDVQWLCYLSSTSVYGDCGGEWVDEDHPVNPVKESAKLRVMAESQWLKLGSDLDLDTYIFRLGGIYGPGRSALDTIKKGQILSARQKFRESKQYTARIHVADIYQAIRASMDSPSSGKIYNLVDDDPAPRDEVFAFALSLLGMRSLDTAIKAGDAGVSGDAASKNTYVSACEKRVLNARMKKELNVQLLYPTYRSGLRNIFESWQLG